MTKRSRTKIAVAATVLVVIVILIVYAFGPAGFRVDVLAQIDDEYIVVELGTLSSIGKFALVEDDDVRALWFADTGNFIYSLSKSNKLSLKESIVNGYNYQLFISNYYAQNHCSQSRGIYSSVEDYECDKAPFNCRGCREAIIRHPLESRMIGLT